MTKKSVSKIVEDVKRDANILSIDTERRKLEKAGQLAKEERDGRRRAEKIIEDQMLQIEQLRQPRIKIPATRPSKSKAGDFCRILLPDTHGAFIDPPAMGAVLADMEVIRPREVVLLGDHLDCGGFLAQHHAMGFVAEAEYSFVDDIGAANEMLDQVQSRTAKGATLDYLEGNHERRIEKWCVTESLRHPKDAAYLLGMHGPKSVLSLEKRNIRYASLYEYHDGLPVQGAIRKGKCHYVHGISHAKHAADATISKFGGSVCFGHTHRADAWVTATVGAGVIGAWSFGCLCKLQPLYLHGKPSGWSHGYGLQIVNSDGQFITFQVPIINGHSMLRSLLRLVA